MKSMRTDRDKQPVAAKELNMRLFCFAIYGLCNQARVSGNFKEYQTSPKDLREDMFVSDTGTYVSWLV